MKKWTGTLLAMASLMLPPAVQAADLTIWALQAFNQKADDKIIKMAQEFGRERGISVEYTIVPANVLNERLAAAIQGGALPDAFMQFSPQVQYYAKLGITMPLDDILAQMRSVKGGIYESTTSAVLYDGKAMGVPLEVDVVPMFARKDLLKAIGMEPPTTLEELRLASKAILKKDPTITAFGHPLSNGNDSEMMNRMILWSYGAEMFDASGAQVTWNSPETVAGYQFIADMFAEGTIPRSTLSWDDAGNNTAYQTGRSAFIMNPPSVYQWMVDNDRELLANTALIPMPRGPGKKGRSATMLTAFAWMVNKDAKRPDDAKAWLRYFFEPERYEVVINTVGGRWLPIYPELYKSMPLFKDNPDFANLGEMAKNGVVDGHAGPPTAWASAVFNARIVSQSLQRMLVDGKSASDSVAWATTEIQKLKN